MMEIKGASYYSERFNYYIIGDAHYLQRYSVVYISNKEEAKALRNALNLQKKEENLKDVEPEIQLVEQSGYICQVLHVAPSVFIKAHLNSLKSKKVEQITKEGQQYKKIIYTIKKGLYFDNFEPIEFNCLFNYLKNNNYIKDAIHHDDDNPAFYVIEVII